MVLRLKTRESRSLPGLPRGEGQAHRDPFFTWLPQRPSLSRVAAFAVWVPVHRRMRRWQARLDNRRGELKTARIRIECALAMGLSGTRLLAVLVAIATGTVSFGGLMAQPGERVVPCAGLEIGPARTVARVIDGETVTLDDGSQLRLIGALAPRAVDAGGDPGMW